MIDQEEVLLKILDEVTDIRERVARLETRASYFNGFMESRRLTLTHWIMLSAIIVSLVIGVVGCIV